MRVMDRRPAERVYSRVDDTSPAIACDARRRTRASDRRNFREKKERNKSEGGPFLARGPFFVSFRGAWPPVPGTRVRGDLIPFFSSPPTLLHPRRKVSSSMMCDLPLIPVDFYMTENGLQLGKEGCCSGRGCSGRRICTMEENSIKKLYFVHRTFLVQFFYRVLT